MPEKEKESRRRRPNERSVREPRCLFRGAEFFCWAFICRPKNTLIGSSCHLSRSSSSRNYTPFFPSSALCLLAFFFLFWLGLHLAIGRTHTYYPLLLCHEGGNCVTAGVEWMRICPCSSKQRTNCSMLFAPCIMECFSLVTSLTPSLTSRFFIRDLIEVKMLDSYTMFMALNRLCRISTPCPS